MKRVNGQPAEHLDLSNRGLAYGDGVFRTLRATAGRLLWWSDHAARLAADCAALGLACPDADLLRADACAVAGNADCVVKLILTRGGATRGYAPADGAVTRIAMAAPLPPHAQAGALPDVRVRLCDLRLGRQPRLAGVKHLNRLENVLARAEWQDPAIFEGLLCDASGWLVGGTMSNLFWVTQGILHTPELDQCGVAGVARARLLRAADRLGIPVRLGHWPPEALQAADEVLICNSLMGVRRVAMLDATPLPQAGWRARLDEALHETPD
ncbi:aminodeoxychorismate lyase [Betaproteobacteria bacterium SCN1]|jgi:4-amino-4-deoxychorismate lyase|nr:aminodeoxychorismate lyase [Betaproteobacteria bacterium SCN1]